MGLERRARRLQNDRRRADVEEGPVRRRQQRRDRPRDGSAGSGHAVRRHLSAPAQGVGLQRRRARQRDLPHARRRRHLDAARQRPAERRQGPHRPRCLPRRFPHCLRRRRSHGPRERCLPQRRRRRDVGGAVVAQPAADVLQPDSRRPEGSQSRLPARIEPWLLHLRRWREEFPRRVQHGPFRGSRVVDRPRRHEPSDRRRRRRRVDLVGPRPDVVVPRQPAHRPVLRDQRRHAGPVHHLRRAAGQRPLVRAERDPQSQRDRQPRRLQHRQRRRLLRAPRSERRAHGDHRGAGRPREPREPHDARAPADRPAAARSAEKGRARAMELEHADRDVERGSQSALHRIEHGVPLARSRRHVESDQPGPDGQGGSRFAADDGRSRRRARALAPRRPGVVLHADNHRRVADRREAALHRQRRRSGPRDEGRRAELDGSDAAAAGDAGGIGAAAGHLRQQRAAVASHGEPRVRHVRRTLQ